MFFGFSGQWAVVRTLLNISCDTIAVPQPHGQVTVLHFMGILHMSSELRHGGLRLRLLIQQAQRRRAW
jgi:hypothetical protein